MFSCLKIKKINFNRWLTRVNRPRGQFFSRAPFLRLDKNERVDHLPQKLFKKILQVLKNPVFQAYPETEELYDCLAKRYKLPRSAFVLTAGSDLGIRYVFEAFVRPGSKIIRWDPSFAMLNVYAKIFQAMEIKVPAKPISDACPNSILDKISSKVSLIYLANPNSPTGTLLSQKNLIIIIRKASQYGIPVLVDEAYFGFCPMTVISRIMTYRNLIVSRTFSKADGLAGLRIGFLAAHPSLASILYRLRPMYEANSIALHVAKILVQYPNFTKKHLNNVQKGRQVLLQYAEKERIPFIDSQTNFVHLDLGPNPEYHVNWLRKSGVLCRIGVGPNPLHKQVRFTVGPIKQMQRLIRTLKKRPKYTSK